MKVDPKKAGKVNPDGDIYALVKNATFNPETESYVEKPADPRPGAEGVSHGGEADHDPVTSVLRYR